MVPPFLNGFAVFAHKHALALAHASRGGKCKRRGSPPLKRSDSGTERAERSEGLHKRSAEDWGASCRAPGTESLPCLYLNVKDTNSRTAPLSLNRAVAFVLRFLAGREPGGVQRQSLKLPYAGWLPHERVSSQACLGLSAGVGEELLPKGLSRITMTGRPVPHPIRWDSSTQVAI